jgi:hypothetical protein
LVLAAPVRTVALTGRPAPGTTIRFDNLHAPALNVAGQSAFLEGDSAGNQKIWSEGTGALAVVARSGSNAPGVADGVSFSSLSPWPALNAAGQTAFIASLIGPGVNSTNDSGIWSEGSGTLALVARLGDQAPGAASGVNFNELFGPTLNDAGQTAFYASLIGSGVSSLNNRGIWSEGSGTLALVARSGSQAPGAGSGVNFNDFAGPAFNGTGQTAFYASLIGSGVDGTNDLGVWSGRSGMVTLRARSGSQAPGMAEGVFFSSFSAPALNSNGQTAFRATLTGSSVSGMNNQGIWSETSGALAPVVRSGSQAAGAANGVNYSAFDAPVLNDNGRTAFRATLTGSGVDGTNDQGIWSEGLGSMALVAREGGHAPGTPSGVSFNDFTHPVLNAPGLVAFSAGLRGNGVTASNNRGIWATDVNGLLRLIVRTGDQLEVAPGDIRTVNLLRVIIPTGTGHQSGLPSSFNDVGQIAFFASFVGGSEGIFISSQVAIPEPASQTLVAIITALVLGKRRGSHLA